MSATETANVRSMASDSISETVVYAIAEATDTDPMDLPPLYDVIDLQALDRLFPAHTAGGDPSARVTFTVLDCEVTVHADGEVVVAPAGESDRSGAT